MQTKSGPRRVGPWPGRLELLGDTEVQQLHRTIRLHQDVGGLEISVDDRVPVGVLHRLAHRAEQAQALGQAAPLRPAVLGEGDPLDVLHREPGRAVGQRARVVQLSDARMVELGQRPLLGEKARPAGRRDPGVAEQLERGASAHVLALHEVDHPHPTLAEQPEHPVEAHLARDLGGQQISCHLGQRMVQERVRRPVLEQQRLDLGDQGGVAFGAGVEESPLLGDRELGGGVEELLHPPPARRTGAGRAQPPAPGAVDPAPLGRGSARRGTPWTRLRLGYRAQPAPGGRPWTRLRRGVGLSRAVGAHGPGTRALHASHAGQWPRRCRGPRRSPGRPGRRRSDSRR